MTSPRKRQLKGTVTSDKMDKTIVVEIQRSLFHSKYHKQYRVQKKYKVHDQKNEYHTGDAVIIEEGRPMSKDKRWNVVSKIK